MPRLIARWTLLEASLCCGQAATRMSEVQGGGVWMPGLTVGGNVGWREITAGDCERASANGSASTCDCPCSDTNLALSALATGVLQLLCFWSAHEILEHSVLSDTPSQCQLYSVFTTK